MEDTSKLKNKVTNKLNDFKRQLQSKVFDSDDLEELEYSLEYVKSLVYDLPIQLTRKNIKNLKCQLALIFEEVQDNIIKKEKNTH